jgi:hypothetical protein
MKHKLLKEKSTKSWIDGKEKYDGERERERERDGIDGKRMIKLTSDPDLPRGIF